MPRIDAVEMAAGAIRAIERSPIAVTDFAFAPDGGFVRLAGEAGGCPVVGCGWPGD